MSRGSASFAKLVISVNGIAHYHNSCCIVLCYSKYVLWLHLSSIKVQVTHIISVPVKTIL